jgi:hypothetical protein
MESLNKKPIHVKPGLYALFYENLKEIAKNYGYNLVLHGSMNRDLDLIAIAWVDNPKDEFLMIMAFDDYLRGLSYNNKKYYSFSILPGNRHNYIININRGDKRGEWLKFDEQYYLDISVIPIPKMS